MPATLVESWREQLAEHEQALADAGRFAWHHVLYARIYRFLLAFYPEADSPLLKVTPSGTRGEATVPDAFDGRPARTSSEIRATIQRIQRNLVDQHPAGPRQAGPTADDWILIGRSKLYRTSASTATQLQAAGVPCKLYESHGDWCVDVPVAQREKAYELVDETEVVEQDELFIAPHRLPPSTSRIDFRIGLALIFFVIMVATCIYEHTFLRFQAADIWDFVAPFGIGFFAYVLICLLIDLSQREGWIHAMVARLVLLKQQVLGEDPANDASQPPALS